MDRFMARGSLRSIFREQAARETDKEVATFGAKAKGRSCELSWRTGRMDRERQLEENERRNQMKEVTE